jgi:hypothetical protein
LNKTVGSSDLEVEFGMERPMKGIERAAGETKTCGVHRMQVLEDLEEQFGWKI